MKNVLIVVMAMVLLALLGGVVVAQSGNDLFQQALVKERTEGNFNEAIKLYQTIVQKYGSDRKLAAKALFQMGQAYEKLGNFEARKAYERIGRDFADQKEVAADAGRRLAALTPPPTLGTLALRSTGIDSLAGQESITPDGRWVARRDRDSGDVAIQEMSTRQVVRMKAKEESTQRGGGETYSVALSPDLSQIAYTWRIPPVSRFSLRVMPNSIAGKASVLVDNVELDFAWADWFPDGKSILAQVRKPDQTWQLIRVSLSDRSVKVIKSLEWRVSGQVFFRPSISPDGRYIAYAALANNPDGPNKGADSAGQHVYILPADGSGPETELVKTASFNERPVWTPDGGHVVFVSNVSGSRDLWSVAVRNGKASASPELVVRNLGDGERIWPIGMTRSGSYYYVGIKKVIEHVSIADLGPGDGRITDSFVGTNPSWSPDGSKVAFTRHSARSEGSFDVIVRSLDTGQEKVFSRKGIRQDPPRWLHDSESFLLIVGDDANNEGWYRLDLKTGDFKNQLQVGPSRARFLAISQDDKTLYTAVREPGSNSNVFDRIVAIDLVSGAEKPVVRLPEMLECSAIALSPDGRTLAIVSHPKGKVDVRLGRVDVGGGNYQQLHAYTAVSANDKLAWAKNGRSILFGRGKPAGVPNGGFSISEYQIMRIGIEGGNPEFTGLLVKNLSSFELGPDGSHIAFSTAASADRDLLAIDSLTSALKNSQ